MLRDLGKGKKISRESVEQAIQLLRGKGWDVNPYTVADELKVPRSNIYRDADLMELLSGDDGESLGRDSRMEELRQQLVELEKQAREMQGQLDELERSRDASWQAGYQAGMSDAVSGGSTGDDTTTGAVTLPEDEPAHRHLEFSEPLSKNQEPKPELGGEVGAQPDGIPSWEPEPPGSEDEGGYFIREDWLIEQESLLRQKRDQGNEAAGEHDLGVSEADKGSPVSEEELRDLLKNRFARGDDAQGQPKEADSAKGLSGSRFVGTNRAGQEGQATSGFVIRSVPPDIRKACLILGIRPEELSHESVHVAWKREITNPGMHPDHGGDTETAIYLNTAKDALYHWLDVQAPKLARKFGGVAREMTRPSDAGNQPEEPGKESD